MTAPLWAVVPVKGFARAKSRLAAVLTPAARQAFARALMEHVLSVLEGSPEIAEVLVATDCPDVAALALHRGVRVRRDAESGLLGRPLGRIVDAALTDAAYGGAAAALVLMADLPWLAAADVRSLVEALEEGDLALAPDAREEGTNGLALWLSGRRETCFGVTGSYALHAARARDLGARIGVVRSVGLAFDVDGPSDLTRLDRQTG